MSTKQRELFCPNRDCQRKLDFIDSPSYAYVYMCEECGIMVLDMKIKMSSGGWIW